SPTDRALLKGSGETLEKEALEQICSKLFEIAFVLVPLDHVAGPHCKRGSQRLVSGCNAARIRSRCRLHLLQHTRVGRTGSTSERKSARHEKLAVDLHSHSKNGVWSLRDSNP